MLHESLVVLPVYAGDTGREGRRYRTLTVGDVLPGLGTVQNISQEQSFVYGGPLGMNVTIETYHGNTVHCHAYDVLYIVPTPEEIEAYHAHVEEVRRTAYTRQAVQGTYADLAVSVPITADSLPYSMAAEVRDYLHQDRTIAAIKHVRDSSGLGLREAKEYVTAVKATMQLIDADNEPF